MRTGSRFLITRFVLIGGVRGLTGVLRTHHVRTDLVGFILGWFILPLSGTEVLVPTGPIFEPGPFPFGGSLVALRSKVPFAVPFVTRLHQETNFWYGIDQNICRLCSNV